MDSLARYLCEVITNELIGARIIQAILDPDEEFAGFVVRLPNGTKKNVWILMDPEGNGCGFLDIEDTDK